MLNSCSKDLCTGRGALRLGRRLHQADPNLKIAPTQLNAPPRRAALTEAQRQLLEPPVSDWSMRQNAPGGE